MSSFAMRYAANNALDALFYSPPDPIKEVWRAIDMKELAAEYGIEIGEPCPSK